MLSVPMVTFDHVGSRYAQRRRAGPGARAAADLRAGHHSHLEEPARQDPRHGEGHEVPGRQAGVEAASGLAHGARGVPPRDDRSRNDARPCCVARSSTSSPAKRPTRASRRRARPWSRRWKRRLPCRTRWWRSPPSRCSSAGSITRRSITASSSPTTAVSASSRRSAARRVRSRRPAAVESNLRRIESPTTDERRNAGKRAAGNRRTRRTTGSYAARVFRISRHTARHSEQMLARPVTTGFDSVARLRQKLQRCRVVAAASRARSADSTHASQI